MFQENLKKNLENRMTSTGEEARAVELLSNPEWRINNLYKVLSKQGHLIDFSPNAAQNKFRHSTSRLNFTMKRERQGGLSVIIALLMLDTCVFNKNIDCSLVGITLRDAHRELAIIKLAYENIAKGLKIAVPLVSESQSKLEWENGSTVHAGTSISRGITNTIISVSEFSKISERDPEKAADIKKSCADSLSTRGKCFISSSASIRAFLELYDMAEEVENERLSNPRRFFSVFG